MKLDLKARLLFLLIVPLFFVILLSSMILLEIYDDKKNLEFTKHHILEAETISKVVHYMQIERGVTSGLIAAGKLDENDEALLEAKKNLNRAIAEARSIISKCTVCRNNVDTLSHLDKIRSRNNDNLLGLSTINARAYYTKNISFFLDLIKATPAQMDDMENRNYIQSYSYLSSAKEALGQTRAILVELFTSKEYLDEPFTAFKEDLRIYALETNNFKTTAPMDILNFYYDVYRGEAVDETFRMINITVQKRYEAELGIVPSYWFEKSTKTINLLKEVEDRLFNDVKMLINDKLDFTSYKLIALITFLVISAIVVTFLMVLIVRKILFSADNLEREYGNSQALLEQYKSTVDGTFIVSKTDADGIITYVNEEFCKLSGYSKEELIGKSHNIMRHPDMQKEVFADL